MSLGDRSLAQAPKLLPEKSFRLPGTSGLALGVGLDEFVEDGGKEISLIGRACSDLLGCRID